MTNKLMKGLVLRSRPYKENDMILTLFTPDSGVFTAMCRGVRRQRKVPAVYCQPFCYSEFKLFVGRSMPVVDDADVIEQFYGLRGDLAKLSLAQYLADVCAQIPENLPDPETLRLLLNSLYLISADKVRDAVVKVVFELRYAALHGFAPSGNICASCGRPACKWVFEEGFLCSACAAGRGFSLDSDTISVINIITSEQGMKPYLVKLTDDQLAYLGSISSQYICRQMGYTPRSLEYYRKIIGSSDSDAII